MPQATLVQPESSLQVVFRAAGQAYALDHDAVLEMVQPPIVVPLPGASECVLGLVNLRGHVMGLVDLRSSLGQPSARAETDALQAALEERMQEHKAWLAELEGSVSEGRPFSLTTDPHGCAFGKWIDRFSSSNVLLTQVIERMNAPHRRIHGLAEEVLAIAEGGDRDRALEKIDEARNTDLSKLIRLFAEANETLRTIRREIAVIVQSAEGVVAVLVDSVEAIEALSPHDEDAGAIAGSPLVHGVATSHADDLVLLLDPTSLVELFQ